MTKRDDFCIVEDLLDKFIKDRETQELEPDYSEEEEISFYSNVGLNKARVSIFYYGFMSCHFMPYFYVRIRTIDSRKEHEFRSSFFRVRRLRNKIRGLYEQEQSRIQQKTVDDMQAYSLNVDDILLDK